MHDKNKKRVYLEPHCLPGISILDPLKLVLDYYSIMVISGSHLWELNLYWDITQCYLSRLIPFFACLMTTVWTNFQWKANEVKVNITELQLNSKKQLQVQTQAQKHKNQHNNIHSHSWQLLDAGSRIVDWALQKVRRISVFLDSRQLLKSRHICLQSWKSIKAAWKDNDVLGKHFIEVEVRES